MIARRHEVSIPDGTRSVIDDSIQRCILDGEPAHHGRRTIIELSPGLQGIFSHGWTESKYLHLWEPY